MILISVVIITIINTWEMEQLAHNKFFRVAIGKWRQKKPKTNGGLGADSNNVRKGLLTLKIKTMARNIK